MVVVVGRVEGLGASRSKLVSRWISSRGGIEEAGELASEEHKMAIISDTIVEER